MNTGCMPSRALLAGKQALIEGMRADKYVELAASYGWEVVHGRARFVADPTSGGAPALLVDLGGGGTRRIRAAHYLIAAGAGDAILAAVYAVKFGMTTQELADTWAPYLTMGESLRLATHAFTRDIAMLSCCVA